MLEELKSNSELKFLTSEDEIKLVSSVMSSVSENISQKMAMVWYSVF